MSLNVRINADASSAIEAFARLQNKTSDLEKGLSKIGKTLDNFASVATKTLTVPIAAGTTALSLATKKAIDFDNSMREVATLLPNISKNGFEVLKKQALDFSKEIGKLPEEIVPAIYDAISAGVPQDNVFEFLKTAGKAAIAGVTDIKTSVNGLTSVTNAYGSEVLEVSRASDIMFGTVRLGKTDYTQLSNTLSNVIPIASSLGVQFEDIGAAIATMTAQGVQTSVATTQIRQTLSELSKEGSVAYNIFKEIAGESFRDFIANGGNLQEALKKMTDYAKKNNKEVSSMFGSIEATSAVLSLAGKNANAFSKNLAEISNSAGATQEAFNKIDEGAARSFERIKAEVSALIIELGNNLLPVVSESILPLFKDRLIPTAEKLIIKISNLISIFNKLPAPIQNASIGFVALVAAMGPALKGLYGLASGVNEAKKAISSMKTTIATLKTASASVQSLSIAWKGLNAVMVATPILATAAAFGALATAIYKAHKNQKELLNTTKELLATSTQMNKEATVGTNLFEEYSKLAKVKELDAMQTQKLSDVTSELIELYPNLKTKIIDGVTYIDHARNKIENYRSVEEDNLIKSLEAKIKEWEDKKRLAEETMKSASTKASYGGSDSDTQFAIAEKEKRNIKEYENQIASLKQQLGTLNAEIQSRINLSKHEINLTQKVTSSIEKNNASTSIQVQEYKVKAKTYKDYLKELKEAEKEEKRRVDNLRALGKDISDAEALEAKKEKVSSILSEMSSSLNLNSKQIKYLSDNYGYALSEIKTDRFEELVKEIENSIAQYERGVEVASQFGEEISSLEQESEKSEIVKNGIESIANEIELTTEQVEILKQKFGELYKVPTENISDYFKNNIADMAESTIGYANDMYSSLADIKLNAIEREIDRLEDRKQIALNSIEEEKNAKLRAIGIMENNEKQSLLNSIKQLKSRQNVALGLYEQERINEELKEKEQALAKIQIEEEAKAKQLEIEKNYNNEKMRLEYNSRMESWKMSIAQATASISQAMINAIASAMSVPFPASLVAYATLAGVVASGAVQIAALQQAKPAEPKYLAKGGLVERRAGGINAVIGEGASDEAVIPLEDRVLAKIGENIFNATDKNSSSSIETESYTESTITQPIILQLDGKTVASTILNISKRGVKVVSERGIIK